MKYKVIRSLSVLLLAQAAMAQEPVQKESAISISARTAQVVPPTGVSVVNEQTEKSAGASMVNEFTGQASFSVNLGGITNHHGLRYDLVMGYYGGNAEKVHNTHLKYATTSWTGLGFGLETPSIRANGGGSAMADLQTYYLHMGGTHELLPVPGVPNQYVLKTNPFVRLQRHNATINRGVKDQCPSQTGTLTTFPTYGADYWTLTQPDGTAYEFGEPGAHCDASNYEQCLPVVDNVVKYQPFYDIDGSGQNARIQQNFLLRRIVDRQSKFAIWFEYQKSTSSLSGRCNSIDGTSIESLVRDRSIYLSDIYATNGTAQSAFRTSQIHLVTGPRTGEGSYDFTLENPLALDDWLKLDRIDYYERGVIQRFVSFNYGTTGRRMRLENLVNQEIRFGTTKPLTTFWYDDQVPWRLREMENSQGGLTEFKYGNVTVDPVNGSTTDYQTLSLPNLPTQPGIAFSRQIGNKFYVQVENWADNCQDNPSSFVERLYEYENNGTHWFLRRTFNAPVGICPTAMDFFMSPDGKYAIWAYTVFGSSYSSGRATKIDIYDLTVPGIPTAAAASFINDNDGGKPAYRVEIFTYPEWFAVYNFEHKKNLSFYWKTAGTGAWNGPSVSTPSSCPSDISPNSYTNPGNTTRTNNYSGVDEGVLACLQFRGDLKPVPGSRFLAAVHDVDGYSILHVFAFNNGIKDYVKGLEKTTPTLPNFTQAQAGENYTVPRPWARKTGYHNTWMTGIAKVAVSDNLIVTLSGVPNKDEWKYLYVLGWDGKQLRYLYDEATTADMDPDDGVDQADVYASNDYFILKNHDQENTVNRDGIWFYKVSLNNWRVDPKVSLGVSSADLLDANHMDWAVKAYPDYVFLEKMQNGYEAEASRPALVSEVDVPNGAQGGNKYHHYADTHVWAFDKNRNLVNVDGQFKYGPVMNAGYMTTYLDGNFQPSEDYILTAVTFKFFESTTSTTSYNSTEYKVRKRSPTDYSDNTPIFSESFLDAGQNMIGNNYSARPVQGGVMVTYFDIVGENSFLKALRFFPYTNVFSNSNSVSAVTSVEFKASGQGSTGADLRTVNFTYPTSAPDGTASPRLMNHISGVPNFKVVKKEFEIGAEVTKFARDDAATRLSDADKNLHGVPEATWTLPDKADWKKPGGAVAATSTVSTAPDAAFPEAFVTRNVKEEMTAYFHQGYRKQESYATDFDPKNGLPRIRVSKSGAYYQVQATVFDHNLTGSALYPFDKVRQTATFQFSSNPCNLSDPKDPCKNVTVATTFANSATANLQKMTSSSITVFDAQKRAKESWVWRPGALGISYAYLDGNPATPGSGGKWVKVSEVLGRQDHAVARCKSDAATQSDAQGVPVTNFFGGEDCDLLGTATNTKLFSSALLTGEEDILAGQCSPANFCMDSFGRWEAGGGVTKQSSIVRSGQNALKVTNLYGPTINLQIRKEAGFMDRRKGFYVSAWMYATPGSNPVFSVEFRKNVAPATMGIEDSVKYQLNLVQEYVTATGAPFPTGKWVKLERTIPYETLTNYGTFASTPSDDYLRIWLGKSPAPTTDPVYLDDIRLHPIDASMETMNYDPSGRVSSALDRNNDPSFIEYDAWGKSVGVRRKDGLVKSATATKLINEQ